MRRAVLTTLSTTAGIVLLLSLKPHQSTPPVVTAHSPATAPAPGRTGGATAHSPATAPAPRRTGGATADGTFAGTTVDTAYGPVQVSVTLRKGRLTKVTVLQVPSGTGRDQEIAGYAVPRLTQEALGAQSARIDAVSGASYTSQGYIQSLQSALDRAGA